MAASTKFGFREAIAASLALTTAYAAYQYNKPVHRVTRIVAEAQTERRLVRKRSLWRRAVEEAQWAEESGRAAGPKFTPRINFNLRFQLACSQLAACKLANKEEEEEQNKAMASFAYALDAFPPEFDLHSLEPNTRRRVSVALDYLAQHEHDGKRYAQAMELYDRALDCIATPAQVRQLVGVAKGKEGEQPVPLSRGGQPQPVPLSQGGGQPQPVPLSQGGGQPQPVPPLSEDHIRSLAGTLNNLGCLYFDMGREDDAQRALALSQRCLDKIT